MLTNCLKDLVRGTNWETRHSAVCQYATDDQQYWFHAFITQVNWSNIVMWETQHNNADLACFKTQTLRATLRTLNQPRGESYENSHVEHSFREFEQPSNVEYVPTNTHSSQGESQLYIFEDNEAVIKMIVKGRNPTMRHVSRTHRVALDWLFDRINLEPKVQIKYVDTENQLADMLTNGQFHAWWMGPSDKRSKIPCRKFFLKTRHVNVGIFLCVKTSSLRPDAKMEEDVSSDMLRPRRRPAKSQRKVVRKDQLHYLRSLHKCVVHLKILIRESLFRREEQKKGSKRAVKFSKGTWHQIKNREREGPSRGIIQKCEPHERSPCAPKLGERSHEETLHQERCARRAAWDIFTSSRMRTKLRFILLLQHG